MQHAALICAGETVVVAKLAPTRRAGAPLVILAKVALVGLGGEETSGVSEFGRSHAAVVIALRVLQAGRGR